VFFIFGESRLSLMNPHFEIKVV